MNYLHNLNIRCDTDVFQIPVKFNSFVLLELFCVTKILVFTSHFLPKTYIGHYIGRVFRSSNFQVKEYTVLILTCILYIYIVTVNIILETLSKYFSMEDFETVERI